MATTPISVQRHEQASPHLSRRPVGGRHPSADRSSSQTLHVHSATSAAAASDEIFPQKPPTHPGHNSQTTLRTRQRPWVSDQGQTSLDNPKPHPGVAPQNCPFTLGGNLGMHLIHGSLVLPMSTPQTASRSVQPFQHNPCLCPDMQIDHTTSAAIG